MFQITTRLGDITKVKCDAIVNAANTSLMGGGGVDGAIHRAAGRELLEECRTLHGCETGQAKITKGYLLPARHVIHTVGPIWRGGNEGEPRLLADCYRNSLQLAVNNDCFDIAFPSISTGVYRFPLKEAAEIAIKTILDFCMINDQIKKVQIVCFDEETKSYYDKAIGDQLIERLMTLVTPSNWQAAGTAAERQYVSLTDCLALNLGHWENLGMYVDHLAKLDQSTIVSQEKIEKLDMDHCVALLISIHRSQYFNGGLSDVITPEIENGRILKLIDRIKKLSDQK